MSGLDWTPLLEFSGWTTTTSDAALTAFAAGTLAHSPLHSNVTSCQHRRIACFSELNVLLLGKLFSLPSLQPRPILLCPDHPFDFRLSGNLSPRTAEMPLITKRSTKLSIVLSMCHYSSLKFIAACSLTKVLLEKFAETRLLRTSKSVQDQKCSKRERPCVL